jgi:hypothetical protein
MIHPDFMSNFHALPKGPEELRCNGRGVSDLEISGLPLQLAALQEEGRRGPLLDCRRRLRR